MDIIPYRSQQIAQAQAVIGAQALETLRTVGLHDRVDNTIGLAEHAVIGMVGLDCLCQAAVRQRPGIEEYVMAMQEAVAIGLTQLLYDYTRGG